jgi:hypothetical protein
VVTHQTDTRLSARGNPAGHRRRGLESPCPARLLSRNIGSFDESRVNLLIQRMSYDGSNDRSDRSDGERGRAIR